MSDKPKGNVPKYQQIKSDKALIRCEKVASMYLRGSTFGDIAKALEISVETVRRDMKRARQLWRKRAERSYARHLNEQLARLDEVETAAWIGWQRSLRDELTTGTEDGFRGDSTVDVTKINRRSQAGNASMLKIIMDVVRQRSELLGLMDEETRNAATEGQTQTVTVVVDTREEAAEYSTLDFVAFKEKFSQPGEESKQVEAAS